MGIQDLVAEDDSLIDHPEITVRELIEMFGREAVRRGLEYTRSLSKADKEFRESVDPVRMEEGYRDAGVEGDLEPVTEKWSVKSKEGGLGLDDGED